MLGKITFFNEKAGEGKILTRNEKVFRFTMETWVDFDELPRAGMMVHFAKNSQGAVTKVVSQKTVDKKKDPSASKKDSGARGDSASPASSKKTRPENGEANDDEAGEDSSYAVSHSVKECVDSYFSSIEKLLEDNQKALTSSRELDFMRLKRFLFTAYNDLYEIDSGMTDAEMERVRNELMRHQKTYENFKRSINYPVKYAYEKIFLRNQSSYTKLEESLAYAKSQHKTYSLQERPLLERLERKEQELKEISDKRDGSREKVEKEVKGIRKRYVDLLHYLSKLREDVNTYGEQIKEFHERYFRDFVTVYEPLAYYLDDKLLKLLNVEAHQFDCMLWERAKKSKTIRQFFMDSGIEGTYSSRTFLKYYLRGLDKEKLNDSNRELFSLLKYLESVGNRNVLIIKNNVESAMRCKYLIESIDKDLHVIATYDAMDTLKDCVREKPDIIMLDYNLRTTNAFEYIRKYREICENEERDTQFVLFLTDAEAEVLKEARSLRISHYLNNNATDSEFVDKMREIL